jgi:hypothetical protein
VPKACEKDEYALSPEEEQLAREIAAARIAVMREKARNRRNLNGNEQMALRHYYKTILDAPALQKEKAIGALITPAQSPGPADKPLPENFALYPDEKARVRDILDREFAAIREALARVLPGDTTLTGRLDDAIEYANRWLREINLL